VTRSKRIMLLVFCCGIFASISSTQTTTRRAMPSSGNPIIVFAVWPAANGPEKDANQPNVPLLDPIAVLRGGRFHDLPGFDDRDEKVRDAAYDDFEKRYFAPGSRYPFFLHGARSGNLVVKEPVGVSCISTTASVELPRLLPRDEQGLALTSPSGLGSHPDRDAAATAADRAAFLNAASSYLVSKGLQKAATASMRVIDIRSLYLGGQWTRALVGSIILRRKDALHTLFLVLTEKDGQLITSLGSYYKATDVEDGTDSVDEIFLSHFDFYNDGIDEIVTTSYYYESWDYTIYKYQDGAWKTVYHGGGGGC